MGGHPKSGWDGCKHCSYATDVMIACQTVGHLRRIMMSINSVGWMPKVNTL